MITLAILWNLNEAFLLRSMLEASEIPAFIPDENTCQIDWGYINALGGVRVQIPEEFVSEATSVLNDFKNGSAGEVVDPVGIQPDFSESVTEEAGPSTSIPETPPSSSVWGPLALIFLFVLVIGGAAIVVQRAEAGTNAIREGDAAYNRGDYNLCVTEYSRALASGRKDVRVYVRRGLAYGHLGKYDEAIADYTQALRLDPQDPYALINRGNAYSRKGELQSSIADLSEAVEVDPQNEAGCNSLAWELATAPQANVRDGKKAIAYAAHACAMSGWKNGNALDTLAAAYAETGDFPNAVKWERAALEIPRQTLSAVADDQKRLSLFEAGQPYHAEK